MKALKCMGCQAFVVVSDSAIGYCGKCHIQLQEDLYLNNELKLIKDEPVKRRYIQAKFKLKKNKSKKHRRKTKKKL